MKEEEVKSIIQSIGLHDSILRCHLNSIIPDDPKSRLPLPPFLLKFACHQIGVAWLSRVEVTNSVVGANLSRTLQLGLSLRDK